MRWTTKARIQKACSTLPGGHRLNHLLQRHITRSLPRSTESLAEVVQTAERHLAAIEAHGSTPRDQQRFFEFGAGYDLAEPLAYAAAGVGSQLLYDIRPVARADVVRVTVDRLREHGVDLPPMARTSLPDYLGDLGITYQAPADARATTLEPGSIDVCTTTSVLEHIAPADLDAISAEVLRILQPGGICSHAIDYHDHFAGADPEIDGLHFLRFDDAEWSRWNSDLQFQNRLRHDDYVQLFEAAGYELASVEPVPDPSFPAEPVVADRFAGRSDLGIGDGWFVLRRPPS